MPFVLFAVVFLHIMALHQFGSNNPVGIDLTKKDKIPFHPYYTIKDTFGLSIFLIIFAFFVFYAPNYLGHPDNYIPANPLSTPAHIVPEWYFLPFYAILRSTVYEQLFAPLGVPRLVRHLGQARRRAGDVRLDRGAVRAALARHLQGAQRHLPPDLQVGVLAAGDRLRGPDLGRRPGAQPDGGLDRPVRDALLLRPLPDHPAAARQARAAATGADQHRQARARSAASPRSRRSERRCACAHCVRRPLGARRRRLGLGLCGHGRRRPHRAQAARAGRPTACSAASTAPPPSAASRSIARSARPATASNSSPSATSRSLGYSEDDIKAIAAEYTVTDGPNDEGEMFDRPGLPFDHVPSPYPNEAGGRGRPTAARRRRTCR